MKDMKEPVMFELMSRDDVDFGDCVQYYANKVALLLNPCSIHDELFVATALAIYSQALAAGFDPGTKELYDKATAPGAADVVLIKKVAKKDKGE